MPCPDGDFHVTPWRPSFHRMETNESPLVGRGKKSARWRCTWCKQPEQLIFLNFFVNKKWLLIELIILKGEFTPYPMEWAVCLIGDPLLYTLHVCSYSIECLFIKSGSTVVASLIGCHFTPGSNLHITAETTYPSRKLSCVTQYKAKLFLEATKTRPHFSSPKVIIQVQTGLEYSIG